MVGDNGISPMLTVKEVVRFLHIHSNTVRRWSDQGLLKTHRVSRRGDRRFRREDVARFLTDMNKSRGKQRKAARGYPQKG